MAKPGISICYQNANEYYLDIYFSIYGYTFNEPRERKIMRYDLTITHFSSSISIILIFLFYIQQIK